MKRLKFQHPFGGKQYPMLVCYVALFVGMFAAAALHVSVFLFPVFVIGMPLAALVVCFFIEQHLTPDEQEICDCSEMPLWNTPSVDLLNYIRTKEHEQDYFTVITMVICVVLAAIVFMYSMGNSVSVGIAVLIIVIGAAACFLHSVRRRNWAEIDETAVCTVVPIDHMYEVKHTSRRRYGRPRVYYISYIVFYQPDGRYVLRAPHGSGLADSILIIKFRGMIRWLPYHTKEGVIS